MDKLRETVTEVLSTKFTSETAEKYEEAIYIASSKKSKLQKTGKTKIYSQLSYEKLGQIMEAKTKEERKIVLDEINKGIEEWESELYSKQKDEYSKLMDKSVSKPKAVKGVHHCREKGCLSDEFYVWSAQTRSSDEAATNFRQCAHCGKRRKEQ